MQAEETELLGSTHRNSPGCQNTSHQSIEWSGSPTLGLSRPQAPLAAHQQTDLPPCPPGQPLGNCPRLRPGHKDTNSAHVRLHQAHWATWERPVSGLILAQLTGRQSLDQASSRHLWSPGPSQAKAPLSPHMPSAPQGSSYAAVQLCFCQAIRIGVVRPVLLRMSVTHCQNHCRPPILCQGLFVFLPSKGRKLFLPLSNIVWSFQLSNRGQKAPGTPMPPPSYQ